MKLDSNGNPDICRITYTEVSEEARVMATSLKLSMNQIIADLTKLSHLNSSPEIKRLLAIGITELEKGTVMAVKALFSEGIVVRAPPPPGVQP